MDLRELCIRALNGAFPHGSQDSEAFPRVIQDSAAIDAGFQGLHTSLNGLPIDLETRLRVSVVMSDLTSIYLKPGERQMFVMGQGPIPGWPRMFFIPVGAFDEGAPLAPLKGADDLIVCPAFGVAEDPEAVGFLSDVRPLAESGRVLIRPEPVIAVAKPRTGSEKMHWHCLNVEPNTPADAWVGSLKRPLAVPIVDGGPDEAKERVLASLLLPYLHGVPLADLAKILDDEHHLLVPFRAAMKELVGAPTGDPNELSNLLNDKVRPALARVDSKFRSIVRSYGTRLGCTVAATAGAFLVALNNQGIAAAVAAMFGTTGVAAVGREYSDYLRARDETKEQPLYLLWKVAQTQASRRA